MSVTLPAAATQAVRRSPVRFRRSSWSTIGLRREWGFPTPPRPRWRPRAIGWRNGQQLPRMNDQELPISESRTSVAEHADLLQRVRLGDRQAEQCMMELLGRPVAAILRNLARGGEAVDDLRQDVLVIVLGAARQGRIPDVPRLFGFASETSRRVALNAERLHRRRRTEINHEATLRAKDPRSVEPDDSEQPELAACVAEVLDSLRNERDRQLLREYYLEGRASESLQQSWSMSSMQLGRILYRARQRFEAAWKARRFDVLLDRSPEA